MISAPYAFLLVLVTWVIPQNRSSKLRAFCYHPITIRVFVALTIVWWIVRNIWFFYIVIRVMIWKKLFGFNKRKDQKKYEHLSTQVLEKPSCPQCGGYMSLLSAGNVTGDGDTYKCDSCGCIVTFGETEIFPFVEDCSDTAPIPSADNGLSVREGFIPTKYDVIIAKQRGFFMMLRKVVKPYRYDCCHPRQSFISLICINL